MAAITDLGYQETIAAAVRAEFARTDRSRSALSEVIGRSRPTAAGRWHGRTPYTAEELEKVAKFLGITVYDLHDSARLGDAFAERAPRVEAARITPPHDPFAQPARSKARRAS